MMGTGKWIARVFQLLMEKGPSMGYFPEPAKLYQICPKDEEAEAKAAFEEAGISVNFCCGKNAMWVAMSDWRQCWSVGWTRRSRNGLPGLGSLLAWCQGFLRQHTWAWSRASNPSGSICAASFLEQNDFLGRSSPPFARNLSLLFCR